MITNPITIPTIDPTNPKENAMSNQTLKRWFTALTGSAALACALATAPPALAVPVLLGNGTLNTADDLTVIQNGSQTLQFLDLTSTAGMSVANALAAYSGAGFHWATGGEVAQLFQAFGITYVSSPQVVSNLNLAVGAATAINAYIGITTFGTGSLGWIDDYTTDDFHTYACIGETRCNPRGFVSNVAAFWPVVNIVGVYLVRDSAAVVSEPASALLVGLGVLGIGVVRRRKARLANECFPRHVKSEIREGTTFT